MRAAVQGLLAAVRALWGGPPQAARRRHGEALARQEAAHEQFRAALANGLAEPLERGGRVIREAYRQAHEAA